MDAVASRGNPSRDMRPRVKLTGTDAGRGTNWIIDVGLRTSQSAESRSIRTGITTGIARLISIARTDGPG